MLEQRRRRADQLDPYPEQLLESLPAGGADPHAQVAQREHFELAFVAALQFLSPRRRTVLLLRDVLDWPAREVAAFTGSSVAGVNSTLQRARAGLEREPACGALARVHAPPGRSKEAALVRRFLAAWEIADVGAARSDHARAG